MGNVYLGGEQTFMNGSIISGGEETNNVLNVAIDTTRSSGIDITCQKNDTCNIYLGSTSAEESFELICEGVCNVHKHKNSATNSSLSTGAIIAITIASVVVVVAILVKVCCCCRKRKKSRMNKSEFVSLQTALN